MALATEPTSQRRGRSRPILLLVALLTAALMFTATACGAGNATSTGTTHGGQPVATAPVTSGPCPTVPTRRLAKTRALSNVLIASGVAHRYLWKPYKAGQFQKGVKGRTWRIVKGGIATAVILDQIRRTKNNVMASPALCRAFVAPLSNLDAKFTALKSRMTLFKANTISNTEIGNDLSALDQVAANTGLPADNSNDTIVGGNAGLVDSPAPAGAQ